MFRIARFVRSSFNDWVNGSPISWRTIDPKSEQTRVLILQVDRVLKKNNAHANNMRLHYFLDSLSVSILGHDSIAKWRRKAVDVFSSQVNHGNDDPNWSAN